MSRYEVNITMTKSLFFLIYTHPILSALCDFKVSYDLNVCTLAPRPNSHVEA